jgi:hypothetical protein
MADLQTLACVAFRLVTRRPQLSDEDLKERLLALGVDAATARRLIVFAPPAAARVAYRDFVKFPDTFYIHGPDNARTAWPLRNEPVFAACLRAAETLGQGGSAAMLRRSATYKNVTAARQADPHLKSLQVGAFTLLALTPDSWPDPEPKPRPQTWWQAVRCWWLARFG